jgi:hypothetical protein
MAAKHGFACGTCKKIFKHDFELKEHEKKTGHVGILELDIDQD